MVFGAGLDVSAKKTITLLLRGIEPDSSIVTVLTELSQLLFQLRLARVINSEHAVNTISPFQRPPFIVWGINIFWPRQSVCTAHQIAFG